MWCGMSEGTSGGRDSPGGEMGSSGHWTEPSVKDKCEVLVAGEQDV